MNRDRVGAWVASISDHPHSPVLRDLLAAYDQAVADAGSWRQQAQTAADELGRLRTQLAECEEDCARLAGHIVANPSGDHQTVLRLHDRRTG